jgi:flavin-binding protein dodecin
MPAHTYKIVEIVGSSETSIEDAIHGAIGKASQTISQIDWFEVEETRGHVIDGKIQHFQVALKVGYRLSD